MYPLKGYEDTMGPEKSRTYSNFWVFGDLLRFRSLDGRFPLSFFVPSYDSIWEELPFCSFSRSESEDPEVQCLALDYFLEVQILDVCVAL